jgi:hypothetical protein
MNKDEKLDQNNERNKDDSNPLENNHYFLLSSRWDYLVPKTNRILQWNLKDP